MHEMNFAQSSAPEINWGRGGQSIVNSNELDPLATPARQKIKHHIPHSPVKCLICESFRVPDSARISLAETPCKSSAMCLLNAFLPPGVVVDDDVVDDWLCGAA